MMPAIEVDQRIVDKLEPVINLIQAISEGPAEALIILSMGIVVCSEAGATPTSTREGREEECVKLLQTAFKHYSAEEPTVN